MVRSDETEWWINAVYEAIKEIPFGRVTTYKHIAELLGTPQRSRQVGICLANLSSRERTQNPNDKTHAIPFYNLDSVPWQRVINSKGMISHRRIPGWTDYQAERLRSEDVPVKVDEMGEFYVDFAEKGWFPSRLPSDQSAADEEDTAA